MTKADTKDKTKSDKPRAASKDAGKSKREKWNAHLQECKEFRDKFGHCKIPTSYKENKTLGNWVQEQRRNFKLMKEGKKPRVVLTDEQIDKLDAIEFHWGFTPDPNKCAESDTSWDSNFAKLQEFHKEHGNFDIPMEDSTLKKLAKWACVQRYQMYQKKSKVKSFMTKPREKKLDEIDFDWDGPRKCD